MIVHTKMKGLQLRRVVVGQYPLKLSEKLSWRLSSQIIRRNSCGCCCGHACWKCGKSISACSLFCEDTPCNVIQRLDIKACNYFRLFGMHENFKMDMTVLESQFKNLQKMLHPDKYTTKSQEERDRSQHNSSVVNQAYQILRSPMERAAYLLKFHNVDILSESGTTYESPDLMMEMFELREAVEDLEEGADAVDSMLAQITASIQEHLEQLQHCLDVDKIVNLEGATKAGVRLKYLSKVQDELELKKKQH